MLSSQQWTDATGNPSSAQRTLSTKLVALESRYCRPCLARRAFAVTSPCVVSDAWRTTAYTAAATPRTLASPNAWSLRQWGERSPTSKLDSSAGERPRFASARNPPDKEISPEVSRARRFLGVVNAGHSSQDSSLFWHTFLPRNGDTQCVCSFVPPKTKELHPSPGVEPNWNLAVSPSPSAGCACDLVSSSGSLECHLCSGNSPSAKIVIASHFRSLDSFTVGPPEMRSSTYRPQNLRHSLEVGRSSGSGVARGLLQVGMGVRPNSTLVNLRVWTSVESRSCSQLPLPDMHLQEGLTYISHHGNRMESPMDQDVPQLVLECRSWVEAVIERRRSLPATR